MSGAQRWCLSKQWIPQLSLGDRPGALQPANQRAGHLPSRTVIPHQELEQATSASAVVVQATHGLPTSHKPDRVRPVAQRNHGNTAPHSPAQLLLAPGAARSAEPGTDSTLPQRPQLHTSGGSSTEAVISGVWALSDQPRLCVSGPSSICASSQASLEPALGSASVSAPRRFCILPVASWTCSTENCLGTKRFS